MLAQEEEREDFNSLSKRMSIFDSQFGGFRSLILLTQE